MKREDHVDYFLVRDEHLQIHARLEAWARWVRVRPHGWQVAPMFRQYRPEAWEARESRRTPKEGVNIPEAVDMEKAVSGLPEKHREAVRWCYYWSTFRPSEAKANGWEHGPLGMCRRLGVTKAGLLDLINSSRSMLRNTLQVSDER